jgi:hypothetical protein
VFGLLGLVAGGCSSSGGGGSSAVTTTTSRPTSSPGSAKAIQFRPVVVVTANPATTGTTAPGSRYTSTTAVSPASCGPTVAGGSAMLVSVDGRLCYEVGPVGADGTDLGRAKAALEADGHWAVTVRARPASVHAMNELFDLCFQGKPSCPPPDGAPIAQGSVAIVVDGRVLSAPTVNGLHLADDDFLLTGNLDRTEARRLADRITG